MGLDTRVCRPHQYLYLQPLPGRPSEQRGRGSLHLAQPPAVRWGGAGEGAAEEADGGDGLPEGVGADEHLGRAEPRLGVS